MFPLIFEAVVHMQVERCKEVLTAKAQDYARGEDRLINFKESGRRQGKPPELALWGYRDKQETAMQIALKELEAGGTIPPFEKWDEWIGDSINYLILLKALVMERLGVKVEIRVCEKAPTPPAAPSKPARASKRARR